MPWVGYPLGFFKGQTTQHIMDNRKLFNEFVRFAKLDQKIDIESISKVANIQMQMDTRVPNIESISKNIPG